MQIAGKDTQHYKAYAGGVSLPIMLGYPRVMSG